MRRVLNVAEKNDASRTIAQILSRGQMNRREGFSKYNKIYEFSCTVFGELCHMVFTSVSGHLLNLDFDSVYRNWQSVPIEELFTAPVRKCCSPDMQPVLRTLQKEVRMVDLLVIWTDCDREGENIGFEVIGVCLEVKPSLMVKRAVFSELTSQAINRAIGSLTEPNALLSDAVDCRQEMDLRTGAAFTRFQTLRLRDTFRRQLGDKLISYGSCQFPTLGLVVERYKQNQAFICETFWKLVAKHGTVEFHWRRGRLFDHHACATLLQLCLESPVAVVRAVRCKKRTRKRPVALDTVGLEKMACKRLGMTAKEAMAVAEKLYTQGYISYPRTETNFFPKEIDLVSLVKQHVNDSQWGAFANRVLSQGVQPRQGNKTDNAHPPIHPIRHVNLEEFQHQQHRRLYEFVVRHFLACISADAQGLQTTVEIEVADEHFSANGLIVTERNYLEVYHPYENWSEKQLDVAYAVGDRLDVQVEMVTGETKPPNLLTEADLIGLMEKFGIGTDATHADHIETIQKRLYVGLTADKRLLPGYLGLGLVDGYDAMGCQLAKPDLRADFETELRRIADGARSKQDVLSEYKTKYWHVFKQVTAMAERLDQALSAYFDSGTGPSSVAAVSGPTHHSSARGQEPERQQQQLDNVCTRCLSCGNWMRLKQSRNGIYFVGCENYPSCKEAIWLDQRDRIQFASVLADRCDWCTLRQTRLIELKLAPNPPTISRICVTCPASDKRQTRQLPANPPPPAFGTACPTANPNRNSAAFVQLDGARVSLPAPGQEPTPQEIQTTCQCGLAGKLFTVRKEGPNKGRTFYACSKIGQGRCNFFAWADFGPAPLSRSAMVQSQSNTFGQYFPQSTVQGHSAGRGYQAGKGMKAVRKCGLCRQPGHNVKNCPEKFT
ncbi:DNA topoisomerase 3-alpha [Trichinella pseudospiralis]|nr:DNA topoisomerase 3-alpha [Trichinella pseudospiralis]